MGRSCITFGVMFMSQCYTKGRSCITFGVMFMSQCYAKGSRVALTERLLAAGGLWFQGRTNQLRGERIYMEGGPIN
eukprot:8767743-Pyramimonas_sp.AAC.1